MITWLKNIIQRIRIERELEAIKRAVDARIVYSNKGLNKWQYVIKDIGVKIPGDCQFYTETYCVDCIAVGYAAYRHVFKLPDGTPHAHCVVTTQYGDYILDNRNKHVVKA